MGDSSVKSRLLEYLKYKRISQIEFTKSIDVSSTYVGAMRKGISPSKLKRITERYPDLNRDWLLYGEGTMLKEEKETPEGSGMQEGYTALLLPVAAFAGNLQMWSEGVSERNCQRIVSPVYGVDYAIPVKGDSMEPRFHDGSVLLIKRINEKAFIPWGSPMVIDTENGVLIKNIYPDDEAGRGKEEYLIAKSLNPNYPPIKIPTSSIYGIYRVMGSLDIFSTY